MGGSEVQQVDERSSLHRRTLAVEQTQLLISFTAADRDWADWVAGHLDELGYRYQVAETPLESGEAALEAIARQRRNGTPQLLIASGALVGKTLDLLDLDRVELNVAPLVVALIEDVALPAEWGDAALAPMFEVPDDYAGSRQLLVVALARALPAPRTNDHPTWRTPEPLPSVFDRPTAAPTPPPGSDTTDKDLPTPASHPRAGLIDTGGATSPRVTDPLARLEHLARETTAAYGPDDVRSLAARTELAQAMSAAGNRQEAGLLLEGVLLDSTRRYGEDDPTTTAAKQHLANSYAALGRHDEALELRRQVFESRTDVLGPQHPRTVSAQHNLANSLAALGRVEEALTLREAAAEVRLQAFGLNDPTTLSALNNLAISYAELGRGEDALLLREAVVRGRERLLGPDDPQTIAARNNLANSLAVLGRHDEARQVRAETLADCERVLRPDHPYTVTARANLAVVATASGPTPTEPSRPAAGPTKPGEGPDLVSTEEDLVKTPALDERASGPAAGPPQADPTGRKSRFWFTFLRR